MEMIGYIELAEGSLRFRHSRFPPINRPALTVSLCSREPCDFVDIKAAPESLTLAKRKLRDFIASNRKLP
jgi:hypothetical protein